MLALLLESSVRSQKMYMPFAIYYAIPVICRKETPPPRTSRKSTSDEDSATNTAEYVYKYTTT
jgi:hypothetical protein